MNGKKAKLVRRAKAGRLTEADRAALRAARAHHEHHQQRLAPKGPPAAAPTPAPTDETEFSLPPIHQFALAVMSTLPRRRRRI
jgi:hypothetical protein